MPFLLQVGASTAAELHDQVGHMAATLGGVALELRGGAGCVMGDAARGARHELFAHRAHLVVSDDSARRTWAYAEQCLGLPYLVGEVPDGDRGGDASGLVSGLVCHALDREIERLFTAATWRGVAAELGFQKGLGGGGILGGRVSDVGRPDRPYPGRDVDPGRPASRHVRWVQARLNFAADGRHPELDGRALEEHGRFDRATELVVQAFQRTAGLADDGHVGRRTWAALNALR
jgi:peptidoglycan hydrolase-like protein with peptidoglycan-binding domain